MIGVTVIALASDAVDPALSACLGALATTGVTAPTILRGPAPSILRNRALYESGATVIAFVDDDVVVSRGWLEALQTAWAEAGPNVGCIAGPIRMGSPGDGRAPRRRAAELMGVSDPGLGAGDVPAATTTFHGGNISFRASALRGIGGFWPVAGAGRLRDYLSEEHLAQHELYRGGWRTLFEPAMVATRVAGEPEPLELARLSASACARRTVIEGDPPDGVGGVMPAVRSTVGATIAGTLGRRELAGERAERAGERIGALLAARIADPTLEPVARETPFRHSIPSGEYRARRSSATSPGSAWCLHRVCDEPSPAGMAVTGARFRELLGTLLAKGDPVPLDELAAGRATGGSFAITFDDGYADNLHVALPILEEAGVPATFFIATGHIDGSTPFWWDEVTRLVDYVAANPEDRGVLRIDCSEGPREWVPRTPGQAAAMQRQLVACLQPRMPEEARAAVAALREWAGPDAPGPDPADRPMTRDELERLASSPLATIAAHTRTHANLRFCDAGRLRSELSGAADDLESWLGVRPTAIAYPFGAWGADVDERVTAAARAAGYSAGFVNGHGPAGGDPMATGRVPATGS